MEFLTCVNKETALDKCAKMTTFNTVALKVAHE
jgi:hypothetical protein